MDSSLYLLGVYVSDGDAEPLGFRDLTAHAVADTRSADPQLIAGTQYPQPHPNASIPLGGYDVIQYLRV